jgi:hypothetical protein
MNEQMSRGEDFKKECAKLDKETSFVYETYMQHKNEESDLQNVIDGKIYPNRDDSEKDDYDVHYE